MPVPLTPADEGFVHQIPEPLPNVVTHHEHWRESYFFVAHPTTGTGDVLIFPMAHYPARGVMDALLLGRIDGEFVYASQERDYGDDPHTTAVGPISVDIVKPYEEIRIRVDESPDLPFSCDITFSGRTRECGLRRGTMKAGHEIVWDQSHMIQSGAYSGSYTANGETRSVAGWVGQRDHSWGIRNHRRCPLWMWLAIQLPDGMLGVWNWEYPNGAPVYLDGCWAPEGDGEIVGVTHFHHELEWTDADNKPIDYGLEGKGVRGLRGRVEITLEDGRTIAVTGEGEWAIPYGGLGGGQHLLRVETDDGRRGCAIYELTGAHHHRYFPEPRAENLPRG